jgi:hypothetical protein
VSLVAACWPVLRRSVHHTGPAQVQRGRNPAYTDCERRGKDALSRRTTYRRSIMGKLIIGVIIGIIIVLWALFSLLGWIF